MTTYTYAPEVRSIAARLILDVAEHGPLADARIEYVWRDKAPTHHGRTVLGRARRIGGLNAFLIRLDEPGPDGEVGSDGPLFVVEISADTWAHLTDDQRVALVDHELCHLKVDRGDDGELVLKIAGHDVEHFAKLAAEQLELALVAGDGDGDDLGEPDPSGPPPDPDAAGGAAEGGMKKRGRR